MSTSATLVIAPEWPPLRTGQDGTIRIAGSRITLDVLVEAFERGLSAEEIAGDFEILDRTDVYAVIAFYLRHKQEVLAYMEEREKLAQSLRQTLEAGGMTVPTDVKEAIRARWSQRKQADNAPSSL